MTALGLALNLSSARSGLAAPTVPQNFTATAGNGSVELSHDAFAGAIDYKFYRSLTNDFSGAVLVSDTPSDVIGFTDDSPFQGERYYYWVTADTVSGETGPSASAYARPYATLAPSGSATLTVPSGTWTLAGLFFGVTSLPNDIFVTYEGNVYLTYDGDWLDAVTEENSNGLSISTEFQINNNSASSFTFWNGEP